MRFTTVGNPENPAILFFHAMGVVGESSERVANHLADRYFCIMPTSTVYCEKQHYISRGDEIRQIEEWLRKHGVDRLSLLVASSIGADLGMTFLVRNTMPVEHAFFDGGQFAQISAGTRTLMAPLLHLAIKSLCWTHGGTLKHIMWCDDEAIRPYFIEAGRTLTLANMRRQMADSLVDMPFPALPENVQTHTYWEFGSAEDHFKYRDAVMKAWPKGNFPVFEGHNHMQYQINDPLGFAAMLSHVIETGELPELPFCH